MPLLVKRPVIRAQFHDAHFQGEKYHEQVFDHRKLQRKVEKFGKRIEQLKSETRFQALVGKGLSSIPLVSALSVAYGIKMVIVRSPGERPHNSPRYVGSTGFKRYLFVDDFVDSGKTLRVVKETIKFAECVGLVLHHEFIMREGTMYDGCRVYKI